VDGFNYFTDGTLTDKNWKNYLDKRFSGFVDLVKDSNFYVYNYLMWSPRYSQPTNGSIIAGYTVAPTTIDGDDGSGQIQKYLTNVQGYINIEPSTINMEIEGSNSGHILKPFQWKSLPFTSTGGFPTGYCIKYAVENGVPDPFTSMYEVTDFSLDEKIKNTLKMGMTFIHEMGHSISDYNSYLNATNTVTFAKTKALTQEWLNAGGWTKTPQYYEDNYWDGSGSSNLWMTDGKMLTYYYSERPANAPDPPISVYGSTHPKEDWAECYACYIINKPYFQAVFPKKYAVMDAYIKSMKDLDLEAVYLKGL
jgi:hypothetical protein